MTAGSVKALCAMLVDQPEHGLSFAEVLQGMGCKYLVHHLGHGLAKSFGLLTAPGRMCEEKHLGFLRIVVHVGAPGSRFVRPGMALNLLAVQEDLSHPEGASHPDSFPNVPCRH